MVTGSDSQRGLGLALVFDAPDEGWVSMEHVGSELERALSALGEPTARLQWPLPRVARAASPSRGALNVDRVLGRFGLYPARLWAAIRAHRLFHLVDHSYSHLLWLLPEGRAGVYCHDLDAYRAALPGGEDAEPWRRAMAQLQWEGLRRAAVVFCSTEVTVAELERLGIPRARLVVAPFGTGPAFALEGPEVEPVSRLLGTLGGRPWLLHVGSGAPRKRLDRLLAVHARLRAAFPQLQLVQHGAPAEAFPSPLPEGVHRTGGPLTPEGLAQLYRGAAAVLQPSDAEGFALPVLEALACGARVVASELPTVREVGGGQVTFVPAGDLEAWVRAVAPHVASPSAPAERAARAAHASRFSWDAHARTVRGAYAALAGKQP